MHYICRTLSTFLFFDAILFSLCPRLAPRRGFVLLFHVKKKLQKIWKKFVFHVKHYYFCGNDGKG